LITKDLASLGLMLMRLAVLVQAGTLGEAYDEPIIPLPNSLEQVPITPKP